MPLTFCFSAKEWQLVQVVVSPYLRALRGCVLLVLLLLVSLVPRPLSEKSRRGLATRPYIALSRADCRVHANQIAVFGYVTLIAM